jgi:cell wall-associated NlpC family hydrolase
MDRRPPLRARRALTWALALAILSPAAMTVPSAGAATAAQLQQARERIDRTSALLAQARTRAERAGGDELVALARIERRLQAQKDALLALESGLAARHAEGSSRPGPAPSTPAAPSPPAAPSTPAPAASGAAGEALVVLSHPPAARTAALVAVGVASPGQRAQETVPAVTGADAGLSSSIDGYLASKASPLTGLGAVFVTESQAIGLDPRFLVAISGAETSFGTYGPSQSIHNPFGMGPGIAYPSWSAAIAAAARNLGGPTYAGDGRVTIGTIQQRWAPAGASNDPTDLNSNWGRNVSTYLTELGGDPLGAVFTGVAAAARASSIADAAAANTPIAPGAYALPLAAPVIGRSGRGPDAAQTALAVLGSGWAADGADRQTGFDDSGLVRWAYARQGITLPDSRAAQARTGTATAPQDLEAGDAIFFSDETGRIAHEGLYIGGGQFVHAPGEGAVVTLSSLYDPAYAAAYAGARRY